MHRVLFLLLIYAGSTTYAARILCIYNTARSHYIFASPLLKKLAARGHEVSVYTPHPDSSKNVTVPNYAEVDLSTCPSTAILKQAELDVMRTQWGRENVVKFAFQGPILGLITVEDIERCAPLTELLDSTTKKYDLLITETFSSDAALVFANKFEVPFVVTVPNVLFPYHGTRVANVANPSYVPTSCVGTALGYSSSMSFFQRIVNTVAYVLSITLYYGVTMRRETEVIRHFLGPSAPSLYETVKNTSLVLSNSDSCLTPAYPMAPNVVQVAGMHIEEAKVLPKEMEKFINESTHGVVYFSMGSVLRGESFPADKRIAFLKAFARLRQRVLWKWEGDTLPEKSDKIMITKWMPQRDILAHPNVKLFISHGGLLSLGEAVYEGVPILGIPIFGDQMGNLKNIERNGAGEILDYYEISEEVVYEKASRLLNDPTYKKNAVDLSVRFKDRPMSPLDTAVYWTEYVIRHRGAPHLRTAAVHMPWHEYLLLDVIAFLVFVAVILFISVYWVIRSVCRLFRPNRKVKTN